jgi:low molecular weight phosphotyrosine protein phosphatase
LFREISKSYKCKTGWSRHQLYLAAYRLNLGGLRHFEHVEWNRVTRLVFVCRGNICRSPYAEVRARRLGLNAISCSFEVSSHSCVDATGMKNCPAPRPRAEQPSASGLRTVARGRRSMGRHETLAWQAVAEVRAEIRCTGDAARVVVLPASTAHTRPLYGLGEGYFQTYCLPHSEP